MSDTTLDLIHDPARLTALAASGLLDSPPEVAFDRLTRLATKILHAPIALVSLIDQDRQYFKSCVGLPEPWATLRETPLSHSFCQHTIASRQPLVIDDARSHPLVQDNLAIRDINVIAYAGIPLVTAEGEALGSFCVIDTKPRAWTADEIDILQELAASVMTEIQLRQATQAAQAAIREREALVSIAAHELKNPLTTLLGYGQLLERRAERGATMSEPDRQAVCTMVTQGVRLKQMVDVLLDAAAIESGQIQLHRSSIDLNELVARIVDQIAVTVTKHDVLYHAPSQPLVVYGDEVRLEQVVRNLIQNAIKYSPDGGPVMIELDAEHRHAQLAVQDRGVGVPAEAIPTLFDRFSRVRTTSTRNIEGLGLGLYVVKEIVERHGGSISVSSTPDEGSRFVVKLPMERT